MPISHINYNLRKKTKLGIPLASEGKDGDLQLCVLGSGVGLYGKIRNKWILFGKASISDTSVDAIDNGGNIPVNLNKFIELDGTVFKVKSTAGAKSKKSLITLNENTTVVGDITVKGDEILFDPTDSSFKITATAHNVAGKDLTISSGSTTAGTTNNIAGGDLVFAGGQGKGTANGGDIKFNVSASGASPGSSLNAYSTAVTIASGGDVTMGGTLSVNKGSIAINGQEGGVSKLTLAADESDDNGDDWIIQNSVDNTLNFQNDKSGSAVDHITVTPNATVASSSTALAGSLAVNGTDGITAGAIIWNEWVFNVFRGVSSRYYYRDQDDLDDWRRWDAYSTLDGSGDIVITTQYVSGHFVVPENCTLRTMYGQVYNNGSTSCPTISVFSGTPSDSSSLTASSRGSAQPNSGSALTSNQNYTFSKTNFDHDLSAGDIVLPTVNYGAGSLQSFIGCLTLKFLTR